MQHPFLRHSAQNWTRTCGFCYRERRRRHVSITWPTNASLTSNCTNNSARYSLPLSWCHSAVCFASSLWGLLICMNFGPAHFSYSGQLKPQLKIAYETEMATKKDWAKAATMLAVERERGEEEHGWKPSWRQVESQTNRDTRPTLNVMQNSTKFCWLEKLNFHFALFLVISLWCFSVPRPFILGAFSVNCAHHYFWIFDSFFLNDKLLVNQLKLKLKLTHL